MLSVTGFAVISMIVALVLFCLAGDKSVSKEAEGIAFLVFGALTLMAAEHLQAVLFAAMILAWGAWCTRDLTLKLSHRFFEPLHHYAVSHKVSFTSLFHH